jgi:hypothetical protein
MNDQTLPTPDRRTRIASEAVVSGYINEIARSARPRRAGAPAPRPVSATARVRTELSRRRRRDELELVA